MATPIRKFYQLQEGKLYGCDVDKITPVSISHKNYARIFLVYNILCNEYDYVFTENLNVRVLKQLFYFNDMAKGCFDDV